MASESKTPPREELVKLREKGMTRDEIAVYYGVALSRVKRWIRDLKIAPHIEPRKSHNQARARTEKRRAIGKDDGLTLLEKARLILDKRVSEDYRGYLLDGRPVRVDALIKAAGLRFPDSV